MPDAGGLVASLFFFSANQPVDRGDSAAAEFLPWTVGRTAPPGSRRRRFLHAQADCYGGVARAERGCFEPCSALDARRSSMENTRTGAHDRSKTEKLRCRPRSINTGGRNGRAWKLPIAGGSEIGRA